MQVTAADVLKATQAYLISEQPVTVIIGDANVIKPQLAGMGEVMLVDDE